MPHRFGWQQTGFRQPSVKYPEPSENRRLEVIQTPPSTDVAKRAAVWIGAIFYELAFLFIDIPTDCVYDRCLVCRIDQVDHCLLDQLG